MDQMRSRFHLLLGFYQVVGGAIGLVLCLVGLGQFDTTNALIVGVMVGAILMYAYSVICGVFLLKVPTRLLRLRLSAVNQAVQVLVISSNSVTYKFVSGLAIIVGARTAPEMTLGLKFSLSSFLIHWGSANAEVFYGIDLIALILVVMIIQEMRRT